MYQQLQLDVELVLQCFRRLSRGKRSYYAIRQQDPRRLSAPEAAARFLYLNRYCFNGLFRTNKAGTFNVPYGPPKRPLIRFESRVRRAAGLLIKAELRTADFEQTVAEARSGDFVYLDPPYVIDERRVFAEYLPGSFTKADLPRLAKALQHIDDCGATFLLSFADSEAATELARPWSFRRVVTRRNIAGFAGARKRSQEFLVTNRGFNA